jgi:hypothetical protein
VLLPFDGVHCMLELTKGRIWVGPLLAVLWTGGGGRPPTPCAGTGLREGGSAT